MSQTQLSTEQGTDPALLGAAVERSYFRSKLLIGGLVLFAALFVVLQATWSSWWERIVWSFGMVGVGCFLPILWLLWHRAAYRALLYMGSRERRYSGVARGWFIPVLNLVRPVQLMADLWNRSAVGNRTDRLRKQPPLPVLGWWAACLAPIFLPGVIQEIDPDSPTGRLLPILTNWMPVIAATLAVYVVARIQNLQLQEATRTERLGIRRNGPIVKIAAVAAAGLVLVSAANFMRAEWATLSPEGTIQAIADAYNRHDVEGFRRYVDTESVLTQSREILGREGEKALTEAPPVAGFIAQFVGSGIGQQFDQNSAEVARQFEEQVVGGARAPGLFDASWLIGGGGSLGRLGTSLGSFLQGGLEDIRKDYNENYRGIVAKRYEGSDAIVTVAFEEPYGGKILRRESPLRMHRSGLHWRIYRTEPGKITVQDPPKQRFN
jgi:hypothetical protein